MRTHLRAHRTWALGAVLLALPLAACGDNEEDRSLPRQQASILLADLEEVERRTQVEGGPVCGDLMTDTLPRMRRNVANLGGNVSQDVRDALRDSVNHLADLIDSECRRKEEERRRREEQQTDTTETTPPPTTPTQPPPQTETQTETEPPPTEPTPPRDGGNNGGGRGGDDGGGGGGEGNGAVPPGTGGGGGVSPPGRGRKAPGDKDKGKKRGQGT